MDVFIPQRYRSLVVNRMENVADETVRLEYVCEVCDKPFSLIASDTNPSLRLRVECYHTGCTGMAVCVGPLPIDA